MVDIVLLLLRHHFDNWYYDESMIVKFYQNHRNIQRGKWEFRVCRAANYNKMCSKSHLYRGFTDFDLMFLFNLLNIYNYCPCWQRVYYVGFYNNYCNAMSPLCLSLFLGGTRETHKFNASNAICTNSIFIKLLMETSRTCTHSSCGGGGGG